MPTTSSSTLGRTVPGSAGAARWWERAVFYQIYIRSFADADGDGLGDMRGIASRLPYLAGLGVDAVWITPFYPSPQHDHGYDVADYRGVDPRFGALADFDAMLTEAHRLGLRVVVDIVPNHTSSEHPWFVEALASEPDSTARERYLFRDGRGNDGAEPPNNWRSVFGGSAWTRVDADPGSGRADGQWYLHLFDETQPDLNWEHPEVGDEFESILRFWLDRGVDGFRIDVAHSLFKAAGLPDHDYPEAHEPQPDEEPMWDRPEVHEVYRRWRRVLDSYPGDRMAVGEAWVATPEAMARYIRADELHQAFNFDWLLADWGAANFRKVIEGTFAAVAPVAATPTWVLSNHDVVRHPTRYGGGAVGLARARAATLTMLALPGSAYLYAGEELGLEQVDVPEDARQDPSWFRTGKEGRDGCRVPLPWSGTEPPFDFGPGQGQPWLPQPAAWADLTVARQQDDPGSTLSFYRRVLEARRALATDAEVRMLDTVPDLLAFVRGEQLVCVLNCGDSPAPLPPEAGELLLSSGDSPDPKLPPHTAAWFHPTR